MTSSLVGSEMCIRDSLFSEMRQQARKHAKARKHTADPQPTPLKRSTTRGCLLYTSDAADDM
eukprot:6254190-Prorocentrum_lima.AAC.1